MMTHDVVLFDATRTLGSCQLPPGHVLQGPARGKILPESLILAAEYLLPVSREYT